MTTCAAKIRVGIDHIRCGRKATHDGFCRRHAALRRADRQSAATTRLLEILREVREAADRSWDLEHLVDLLDEAVEIVEGGA